jgi:hypothetical protein
MDPLARIAALDKRREALEQELLKRNFSEAERIAIHQRIAGIDGQVSKIEVPRPPDTRSTLTKARDELSENPIFTGSACVCIPLALWVYCMPLRHRLVPYSAWQRNWRASRFKVDFSDAAKVSPLAMFCRGIRPPHPTSSHGRRL